MNLIQRPHPVFQVALVLALLNSGALAQGEAFCFGDGGDANGCTPCPCSNDGTPGLPAGCLNSAGRSARLLPSGSANVNDDTLRFEMIGGVPSQFGLLVSGDNRLPNNPANACFGSGSGVITSSFDGLRCVSGNFRRHGVRATDLTGDIGLTNAGWGGQDAPSGGLSAQASFAAGQTRQFQIIYRDDSNSGCGTGLNTTNGVSVTFSDLTLTDVFFEDFEAGIGSWFTDNGLWQVGVPSSGPGSAYSGINAAATVLSGNYPDGQDSRLISPVIQLPTVSAGQALRLNYSHWFSYGSGDSLRVQVSDGSIGAWTTLPCVSTQGGSSVNWSQHGADLSNYSGQTIRLAFYTVTNNVGSSVPDPGPGSFLDDIHIILSTPTFESPETFENGLGEWWSVSNGLWEVGTPANPTCLSGQTVGTVIDGNYPDGQDSRLISPPLDVPSFGFPLLRFEHWFSLGAADNGTVQVSEDGGCTWTTVSGSFTGNSSVCSSAAVDLSAYGGQTILIGFLLSTTNTGSSVPDPGPGWFIDNVRME